MHTATARCSRDHEELPLPLPRLQAFLGWGGEGRPHVSLTIAMLDGDDNHKGNCLSKKKGLDKGKGEGEFKDRFVFSCCLILLLFFGFSFSM